MKCVHEDRCGCNENPPTNPPICCPAYPNVRQRAAQAISKKFAVPIRIAATVADLAQGGLQ
jgi:hypothetical protein